MVAEVANLLNFETDEQLELAEYERAKARGTGTNDYAAYHEKLQQKMLDMVETVNRGEEPSGVQRKWQRDATFVLQSMVPDNRVSYKLDAPTYARPGEAPIFEGLELLSAREGNCQPYSPSGEGYSKSFFLPSGGLCAVRAAVRDEHGQPNSIEFCQQAEVTLLKLLAGSLTTQQGLLT